MLLLLAHLAVAEPYALAQAGVTVDLPAGWRMTRWSDWDLTAQTETGLAMEVWYTPWQLPVDAEVGKAFGAAYAERLEAQRATDVAAESVAVETVGGREGVRTRMGFDFGRGGSRGVLHAAALPADGKVLHVLVYAAAINGNRAAAALGTLVERTRIDAPAKDLLSLSGRQETPLGVAVTLPEGWRVPLPSEQEDARALAGVTGAARPAECFTAARPAPADGTALLLLCRSPWTLGVLDADSAADKGLQLRDMLFGKAADKVPAPEPVALDDRTALLFRPTVPDHDLRLAILPDRDGALYAWLVGPEGAAPELERAARASLDGLAWPEGDGLPAWAMGEVVVHTLTYRPFHPAVLAAAVTVLGVLGLIGRLIFRRPPPPPPTW